MNITTKETSDNYKKFNGNESEKEQNFEKIDDNSKNVKKEQLTAEESETENIKSPKEIIITSPQDKKKLTDDIFAKIEALKSSLKPIFPNISCKFLVKNYK